MRRLLRHAPIAASVGFLVAVSLAVAGQASAARSGAPRLQPRPGGTLVADSTSEPVNLDPAGAGDSESLNFIEAMYDTLVQFAPDSLALRPDLATHWTDSGGRVYTFTIRKGVHFWNGDLLTPEDVAYTLTRIINPKTASGDSAPFLDIQGAAAYAAGKAKSVSGISVHGDVVTVRLAKPEAYFLSVLATVVGGIVDPAWVAAHHNNIKTEPMGTGPFEFQRWVIGQSLTMVKNPHYWQTGYPHLDRIVVYFNINPQVEFERFLSHQADLIGSSLSSSLQIGSANFLQVLHDRTLYTHNYVRGVLAQEYNIQLQPDGPLAKPLVRQAIAHAIDPKGIAAVMNGRIVLGPSLVPPGLVGYDPHLKTLSYDPSLARRMLAEAGYPHGFSTEIVTVNDPETVNIDDVIQHQLSEIGVKLSIRAVSLGAYLTAVFHKGTAPVSWGFWLAQFPNGVNFMYGQFDTHSGGNVQGYYDPVVQRLIEEANVAPTAAQQARLLDQAQAIVVDKDAPSIPIGYGVADALHASNLMPAAPQYYLHPVYEIQWKYLWLK
jgi:oligopeptide transport system substrate-binding protein